MRTQAISRGNDGFESQTAGYPETIFTHLNNGGYNASYGLRQEIPFERWIYNNDLLRPLQGISSQMNAKATALLAACEGTIKTLAATTNYVFSMLLRSPHTECQLEVLKAQWQGLTLSLLAVVSPNWAKAAAHPANEHPRIGHLLTTWYWGTIYYGEFDIPFWHIGCNYYPWEGRPAVSN